MSNVEILEINVNSNMTSLPSW